MSQGVKLYGYRCKKPGYTLSAQGKGEMETYWLIGVRNSTEDITNYNNNNNNNSGNKTGNRKPPIRGNWPGQPTSSSQSNVGIVLFVCT